MKTIKELRAATDMTQLDLANAVGVTPVTVYNWERRRHEPTATQLRKIAAIFGVSMDEIDFEATDKLKEAA